MRRIELDRVDSTMVVRKRTCGVHKFGQSCEGFDWNSQMTGRICEIKGEHVQAKLILEAVRHVGEYLRDKYPQILFSRWRKGKQLGIS